MDTAKLFKNGRSQAVRLPRSLRLEGDEVYIKKLGKALILIPKENPWEPLIKSLDEFTDDFMNERPAAPRLRKREAL